MPELPEVETTRTGLAPYCHQGIISHLQVRQPKLRWPVPEHLEAQVQGGQLAPLLRRAKYLLLPVNARGYLIWHLGMSGKFRVLTPETQDSAWRKHEHIELGLTSGVRIRYEDPRRFGALLWHPDPQAGQAQAPWPQHPLLTRLGPEPLSTDWQAEDFYHQCQTSRKAIKVLLMEPKCVVGVGNIYATEALFAARLHPQRPATSLSFSECALLVSHVKRILTQAIAQGGTSLKDFASVQGDLGYFVQSLQVYGRTGQACYLCATQIQSVQLAQRTSAFCPQCQPLPAKEA